jgi:3-methyladenine DNA glycosylase Mpg
MRRTKSEESGLKTGVPAPLAVAFYVRDPRVVSRALLGKVLVRREGRKAIAGRIVEVEAYLGIPR